MNERARPGPTPDAFHAALALLCFRLRHTRIWQCDT